MRFPGKRLGPWLFFQTTGLSQPVCDFTTIKDQPNRQLSDGLGKVWISLRPVPNVAGALHAGEFDNLGHTYELESFSGAVVSCQMLF
jgi:hypothetical protein